MPMAIVRTVLAVVMGTSGVDTTIAPAAAPSRPDLVVWPATPELESELDHDLRVDARFELQARDSLVRRLDEARAAEAQRRTGELAEIERVLASARESFLAQRFDDMQAQLVALHRDRLALLADPRHCATLWEVEFRLGLAYQFRKADGDVERMQQQYALALALDPGRRPLREAYGPDVIEAFLAAVDAQSGRTAHPLRVTAKPRDLEVHVDCRPVPPTGVVDLPPGLHVVHARGPGFSPQAIAVDTDGMEVVAMQPPAHASPDPIVRLGATTETDAIDPRRPTARKALAAASSAWGAEITVLVWRSEGKAAARALVGAGSGPVVLRDDVQQVVAAVLAGIDDAGRLRATTVTTTTDRAPAPAARKRKPVHKTWWFWTILGTVVVGGVAVAVGLTVPKRSPDRLVITGPR